MAFVAKDYLKNPSLETLKVLRKSDLLALGKHFDLEVKTAIRKCSILNVVIQHMVDEQLLDEVHWMAWCMIMNRERLN